MVFLSTNNKTQNWSNSQVPRLSQRRTSKCDYRGSNCFEGHRTWYAPIDGLLEFRRAQTDEMRLRYKSARCGEG